MSGLNPCSTAGLEEFCQALVFEASNHSLNVPCNVSGVKAHNAEHSGDLGMATKEPWKGRPAAIGRVLLRLVKGLFTLGFYWAPNAECQLPILCAILTHCARNQATE